MITKDNPVRSKKLKESARGENCTLRLPGHCNSDPSTSVLCHLPHGQRGVGTKASDDHAVIACSGCHAALDRRALPAVSQAEMYQAMVRAMAETYTIWRNAGLIQYA